MRSAAVSCLAVLGLCACGPAPVPPPPPAPTATAAPAPEVPTAVVLAAAPAAPSTPLPPWVARPDDVACTWSTQRLSSRAITMLRLRPGGPVFARVTGGRAQVQIPVGAGDHGLLDVGSDGLVLTGVVGRGQITLFAAKAFAMNGVVFPLSTTPLWWTEGFPDGVGVTMDLPKEIIASHPPVVARRPCADLTLDRGATLNLEKDVLGRDRGAAKLLRGGSAVEVFSDPARPAEVKLVLPHDGHAQSFAVQGGYSRIGIRVGPAFVAGWVKSEHLQWMSGGGGASSSTSGSVGIGEGKLTPLRQVECSADVPVIAEAGGEKATVGYIVAKTLIDVIDVRGELSRVYVKTRNIHSSPDAVLLARVSDLAACRTS